VTSPALYALVSDPRIDPEKLGLHVVSMRSHLKNVGMLLLLGSRLAGADPEPALDRRPEVVEKVHGEFPKVMVAYQTLGYVTIELTIDREGRPHRPVVQVCTHFEFEAPAIEAAMKWKFRPALKNGESVEGKLQVGLSFSYRGGSVYSYVDATLPFEVPPVSPREYVEELRYDSPPRLTLMTKAVYPRSLVETNVKGSATVEFLIDPTGRPRRIEAKQATHPEFAAATRAMVASWRFAPAQKAGKATWTSLSYRQFFSNNDRDSPLNPAALRLVKELKPGSGGAVVEAGALDAKLEPFYRVQPALTDELVKARGLSTAIVECVVDREGRVQLPRVVQASSDEFGWLAATAAARWLFAPPLQGGKPVDVVVRIPFEVDLRAAR
jgi:TonB family protein